MKLVQIAHSGSTQTSYEVTPVQPEITLDALAADGDIIERPELVECVALPNVERVIQVKSGGAYTGTTGRFFALCDDYDYSILARAAAGRQHNGYNQHQ
jgi:hypothetical protein